MSMDKQLFNIILLLNFIDVQTLNTPIRVLIASCYYRKEGQETQKELQRRDLKQELEERERRHFSSKHKGYNGSRTEVEDRIFPRIADADDVYEVDKSDDDRLTSSMDNTTIVLGWIIVVLINKKKFDDDDDDEALMAELEIIRKERAEEKRRQDREEREQELKLKKVKQYEETRC
ncbi:hypothetical protein L1987_69876 [Smallanthus sonchifolius]|uniref:Uncharacterized protein n=1 Tax=Smallanthus sonchifolius TaxID=185202 RepID=A0ACB9B639_9ASTR|nr:hypothetical protein L1987_69876 [Smallanthus sonchifolius]